MEFESIKKIVEAEQQADRIKEQAMQDAEKLIHCFLYSRKLLLVGEVSVLDKYGAL